MKVAIVVERFGESERHSGGVETAAFGLAQQLDRRGFDTTVFCREATGPAPEGVRTVRLRVPRVWQPLRLAAFSRAAARATASSFDVVHSFARTRHQHIYRTGGGSHAAYLDRVYRRPALRRLSPRHRAILHVEEAVFRDESQLIQCNAPRNADDIMRRYGLSPERVASIYNGVDIERFHPRRRELERAKLREELELDGPVALFVGSGFARKGLDLAIEALGRTRAPAALLVAGAGDIEPYRRLAARLSVAGRVRFLGPRSDVAALHAAADLFLLPTRYDAFSNACLEAMASGLPVATTDQNGVADLLRHGENGYLFGEDFAPAMALLEDPATLARVGERARRTAEGLGWERHAREVIDLYERVRA